MYDAASGVEVYLRPYRNNGEPLADQYAEHEALEGTPFHTGDPRERWIEATADERYEIVIVVHPEFSFESQSHVKVRVVIDQGAVRASRYIHHTAKGPTTSASDRCSTACSMIDGAWKIVGFKFSEVIAVEGFDITSDQEELEINKRGVITIAVFRGQASTHDWGADTIDDLFTLPKESSKKVAVDNGRSHSFEPVVVESRAPFTGTSFVKADEPVGTVAEFKFNYASRMIIVEKILKRAPALATKSTTHAGSGEIQIVDQAAISDANGPLINANAASSLNGDMNSASVNGEAAAAQTSEVPLNTLPLGEKRRLGQIDNSASQEINTAALTAVPSLRSTSMPLPTSRNAGNASEVKTEAQDEKVFVPGSASDHANSDPKEKAKKRARVMLALEEIELRKQLIELED